MEANKEHTEAKGKILTYVRWLFVSVMGLLIVATVVMAVYRKFGG